MRPAIAWLTHFFDPEGQDAFARLKQEASRFGDVFEVRHGDGIPTSRGTGRRDLLCVSDDEVRGALPRRTQQAWMSRGRLDGAYTDCLHMAVLRRLYAYGQVWLVEYDVGFSGHWGGFFSEFRSVPADLLGTTLASRQDSAQWENWLLFGGPSNARRGCEMRGFFPVLRVSRRFAEAYSRQVATDWTGHFEALYPTVARHCGLTIEDIGGHGPLTPPTRRGRLYASPGDPAYPDGTFWFRPAVADRYFPDARVRLPADHLWHPVKTRAHAAQQTAPGEPQYGFP